MSEALHLWWADLNDTEKLCYGGGLELFPSPLMEERAKVYRDLDTRVYRPFNPETMRWQEYVHTSDYIVHMHHERKKKHEAEEVARKQKKHLAEQHGVALGETMSTQDELHASCEGCYFQEPSQRYHECCDFGTP